MYKYSYSHIIKAVTYNKITCKIKSFVGFQNVSKKKKMIFPGSILKLFHPIRKTSIIDVHVYLYLIN